MSYSYFKLLAVVRYLYQMPYRQLEGFTRALHRLLLDLPTGDYSGLLRRIQAQPADPYVELRESTEPVTIAVDSTGISVHRAGDWVERKHGKKKRYVKLHFAVKVETHEVVWIEVSTDDEHDVKELSGLVEESRRNVRVSRLLGDCVYDSSRVYGFLEGLGVEVVVKPKVNARLDRGPLSMSQTVDMIRELGLYYVAGVHGVW